MKSNKKVGKPFSVILFTVLMVLSALLALSTCASAASDDEIEQSIEDGLAWLASEQGGNGSWNGGGLERDIGATGLALLKFIEYAKETGMNPIEPDYIYSENVINGTAFLNTTLVNHPVGAGYDGNSNGNMTSLGGVWMLTYNTGIGAMAYAANPNTPPDLVQDLTDWLVNAQCTNNTSTQYGVWGYNGFSCFGDNSNTGYATLGLGYALSSGATIPDSTKTALSAYVDYIQNDPGVADDASEDDPDGGSGYFMPDDWVNSLKTGNLIYEAVLSGDNTNSQRILNATDYLYRHWNDDVEGWMGNMSAPTPYNTQYQAAYSIMKGLESIGMDDLNGIDWFDNMSTVLVSDQHANGSWSNGPNYVVPGGVGASIATDDLCTTWALLTLEKIAPPSPSIEGRMTGGGSVFTDNGMRVTHGFTLHCNISKGPNNLEVNWGKGNKFHLESLDSAFCFDDPSIDEAPPVAGFDSYRGTGTGRYNGVSGATAEWFFTDAGEPGKNNDIAEITITDVGGNVVLVVSGTLNSGNQQAHED